MDKVNLNIDGVEVIADPGASILQVALQNGIYIPHLCYHPELKPSGICRLCMVEVSGEAILSCRTPVEQGTVIKTRSAEIDQARRVNVELVVANHHVTCRGCPATGKCELQKIMAYIRIDRKRLQRMRFPREETPLDELNPDLFFGYDSDKCVLCEICVHTCEDIQDALHIIGRGYPSEIAFYGDASRCESCRECVAKCPVGALIPKKDAKREFSPRLGSLVD